MKKYRLQGVLLIDSLFGLLIVVLIYTTIISSFQQLINNYQEELYHLDNLNVMLNAVKHYKFQELAKGVTVDEYYIHLNSSSICGLNAQTHIKTCIKI
ncbi:MULTISPECIES: hypothetical protein [Staphylococcus]|uniref:hypothetical protein n=1 Tax=Staphylococcus TaxID=1279 RepID=UPI0008A5982E|nr:MULTISPECIES: hypothetical protein [Staphylococcus]ARB77715.1 hypothetical protein A6J61_05200 [Staphylococcus lugdunensis]ARJ18832.1 hypothetical protein B7467_07460 [Staphylococcus lugdunensis]MBM7133600.1 hypothetical protein [Staphylococcus lugdunensis]MCH8642520.1 hypothetical protein [Staphylococcus lugdunensis]MCH8643778.1 hypothetical protein [Staphylococcus lugdunensis]